MGAVTAEGREADLGFGRKGIPHFPEEVHLEVLGSVGFITSLLLPLSPKVRGIKKSRPVGRDF